jgi:flagellar biosynthesis protein FlhG
MQLGEGGLRVTALAASREELASLDEVTRARRMQSLMTGRPAGFCADLVAFDTSPGTGHSPLPPMTWGVDHLIVVVSPERMALADSYALLKEVARHQHPPEVSILFNRGRSTAELGLAAQRLLEAANRFLRLRPKLLGWVPFDEAVPRSIAARVPFVNGEPQAKASAAVRVIARRLAGIPRLDPPRLEIPCRSHADGADTRAIATAIREAA